MVQGLHAFLSNKHDIQCFVVVEACCYQISVVSLDDLVPQDHLVRKIQNAIDFLLSTTW
jgi:hypothetical protein